MRDSVPELGIPGHAHAHAHAISIRRRRQGIAYSERLLVAVEWRWRVALKLRLIHEYFSRRHVIPGEWRAMSALPEVNASQRHQRQGYP